MVLNGGGFMSVELSEVEVGVDEDNHFRTDDIHYGKDYWDTLDNGQGYQDSTMWEDIAHIVKEIFGYDHLNRDRDMRILDVGCAYGFLVKHLRRRGFDAWGVDLSEYALGQAPVDVKDFLRQFDLSSPHYGWHFGDGWFQAFTCFEVMEHLVEDSVPIAVGHLFDCLSSGGVGVLSICTQDQPGWNSDPTHACVKSREFWVQQFKAAGFTVDDTVVSLLKRNFHLFRDHKGVMVVRKP